MRYNSKPAAGFLAASIFLSIAGVAPARAQDWFVPPGGGQQRPGQAPHPAQPGQQQRSGQRQQVAPQQQMMPLAPPVAAAPEAPPRPISQFQFPPDPVLPPIPKGVAPPAAVIGVLGVPEVMRACTAAQEIERVIGQRRQKLNDDAQKEQTAWRDLQQQLVSQRGNLTPDQIRAKERELQERITNAQRQFRDRNRVIQEAAQYSLAQIERTLIGIIRQVADSRGMNLVLHRNQVALNINEFDLTEAVATQLNKVLPSVTIPADGQEPPTIPLAQAGTPSQAAAPTAAPAAPAAAPPAAAPPVAVPPPALAPAPASPPKK